jgi:hypothetical protein
MDMYYGMQSNLSSSRNKLKNLKNIAQKVLLASQAIKLDIDKSGNQVAECNGIHLKPSKLDMVRSGNQVAECNGIHSKPSNWTLVR